MNRVQRDVRNLAYKPTNYGKYSFKGVKNSNVNYNGSFYNINSNKSTTNGASIDLDTGVLVKTNHVNQTTNSSISVKGLISSVLAVFAVIFVIVYACTHTENVKTEYNVNNELERVYLDMPDFNIMSYLEVLEKHGAETSTANELKDLLSEFKKYSDELTFSSAPDAGILESEFWNWLGDVIEVSLSKAFGFMTGFISLIITVVDTVITVFDLIGVLFSWG